MTWLIFANVVAIGFLVAAACPHMHSQADEDKSNTDTKFEILSGTNCSVFIYNKRCCLPGSNCIVMIETGNFCSCSPNCYEPNGKCCEDIRCPSRVKPKTCQDFGCCYKNLSSDEFCKSVTVYNEKGEVQDPKRNCTNRSNCPQTCTEAKMNAGYCVPQFNESCYVEEGECYCHPLCFLADNCCDDAKNFIESWINQIIRIYNHSVPPNLVKALKEIFDEDNAFVLDLAAQLMKIQMKDDLDALAIALPLHRLNENQMVHT